jgi:hypothetical protein
MDTETLLQQQIDEHPGEAVLYGELADFLLEHGDPRGPGYMALYRLGKRPCPRSMPGYHNGAGTTDIELSQISKLIATDQWVASEWKAHQASKLSRRMQARHRMRLDGGIWVDAVRIHSNQAHALPPTWYRACWGGKWWTDEDVQMEWVISKERRTLDDLVAAAFARTPQAFRDHILLGDMPIKYPFIWTCPVCNGSRHLQRPKKGTFRQLLDKPYASIEEAMNAKPMFTYEVETVACGTCNGRGVFREDDGND